MLTRDYIMRMIETLSMVLSKVLLMKDSKNITGADDELNSASQKLIGLALDQIITFSDGKLIELFSLEKDTSYVKMYVVGVLLDEKASLKGNNIVLPENEELFIKSLSLFLEAYIVGQKHIYNDHETRINKLTGILKNGLIPEDTLKKLFKYYEMTGKFGKAEDVLFELIETDTQYMNEGIAFCERLLEMNDESLNSGNLPREEVKETLNSLKDMM